MRQLPIGALRPGQRLGEALPQCVGPARPVLATMDAMAPVRPTQETTGARAAPRTIDRREGPYGEVALRERGGPLAAPGTDGAGTPRRR